MEFIYTINDLRVEFENITSSRLYQLRNGPGRAKKLLVESVDFCYEKTKIIYSNSALEKLEKYFEKKK
jgi:hypothetical protein